MPPPLRPAHLRHPSPADGGWVNNRLSPTGQMGPERELVGRGKIVKPRKPTACMCKPRSKRSKRRTEDCSKPLLESLGARLKAPPPQRARFRAAAVTRGGSCSSRGRWWWGRGPQEPLTKHSHQHITRDRLWAALLSQHRFKRRLLLAGDSGLDLKDRTAPR